MLLCVDFYTVGISLQLGLLLRQKINWLVVSERTNHMLPLEKHHLILWEMFFSVKYWKDICNGWFGREVLVSSYGMAESEQKNV